jgi:hypothetical protein
VRTSTAIRWFTDRPTLADARRIADELIASYVDRGWTGWI